MLEQVQSGDFLWCNFPLGRASGIHDPETQRHIVYVYRRIKIKDVDHLVVAMATSKPRSAIEPHIPGEIFIDAETSKVAGMGGIACRVKTMELGVLPLQKAWFPEGRNTQPMRAPKKLKAIFDKTFEEIATRHAEMRRVVQGRIQKNEKKESIIRSLHFD